jgi:dTDP-4-dehydrorhamnose 3,5-epimerase
MELRLGGSDYYLVSVPTQVWNGFSCVGTEPAMVCNVSTVAHDPDEILRRDPDDPLLPQIWFTE